MSMKTNLMTAAAVLALTTGSAFAAAHESEAGNPMVGGAEMMPDMTIVENASNAENLSTLVAAVQAAGLVETLSGEGPFTVFAPTNDAFAAIDAAQLEALLLPENQAQLAGILTCHVVGAEVMAADLIGLIEENDGTYAVETLGGCTLSAALDGEMVTLTDERGQVATVITADVDQSNGVVHVIDTVILPAMPEAETEAEEEMEEEESN